MANLIKVKKGVRLMEATLRSGAGVVVVAYTVKRERTPEAKNFNTLGEAERYFDEEVHRSPRPM